MLQCKVYRLVSTPRHTTATARKKTCRCFVLTQKTNIMAKGKGKGNPNGVKYSKTVTKAVTNWKLDKDVINAASAKEIRKELNRVFDIL